MNCRDFEAALAAALNGDRIEREPAASAHVQGCASCRGRTQAIVLLEETLFLAFAPQGADRARRIQEIVRQVDQDVRARRADRPGSTQQRIEAEVRRRRRRRLSRGIGLAAAALLLITGGLLLVLGSPRPPSLARVEHVSGAAWIDGTTARPGDPVQAGQRIGVGSASDSALLSYADGTKVALTAGATVTLSDRDGGMQVFVEKGSCSAIVRPQRPGHPMELSTPHAFVKVIGTTLRIVVVPGELGSTRLDLTEGKVEFKRTLDGKTVEIVSGHYAVAAAGVDLEARPIPPMAATLVSRIPSKSWLPVPNTKLRAVVPDRANYPKIQGIAGPAAVVDSWSGAAFDDRRRQLLVWGGGATNYYGNELYAFRLDDLAWERLTDPTPEPLSGAETNADGTPNGRSTYNGLAFLGHADRLFAFGGKLAETTGAGADSHLTWTFDPSARKWENRNPSGTPASPGNGGAATYDPGSRRLWWADPSGLYSYSYESNAWVRHSTEGSYYQTGAIDTKRGLWILVGRGQVFACEVRAGNFVRRPWKTQGGDAFIAHANPGLDYDPTADRIVGWAGGAVYALDPESRVWTAYEAPGAPPPTSNGIFGRWRYVPSLDAFILLAGIDHDVHFFKLGSR